MQITDSYLKLIVRCTRKGAPIYLGFLIRRAMLGASYEKTSLSLQPSVLIDLSQYPSAKWTLLCVNASRNVQATPLLFCPHLPSRRPQWELQEQQWPIGAPSYAEGACTSHKVFFSLSLNKTTNSLWKKSDQDEPQHQPYTLSTNTSPWRRKSSYDFRMLDNYTKIFLENLEWK